MTKNDFRLSSSIPSFTTQSCYEKGRNESKVLGRRGSMVGIVQSATVVSWKNIKSVLEERTMTGDTWERLLETAYNNIQREKKCLFWECLRPFGSHELVG